MDSEHAYFRSPELMNTADSVLVVVDVQAKLLPLVKNWERVEWNVGRLVDGARILGVPCLATEQYPEGLGGTIDSVQLKLDTAKAPSFPKTSFSCCGSDEFRASIKKLAPVKVLLCGIEAHVCILQTAMDLIAEGFRVSLAVDAISGRSEVDHEIAVRRLESEGAVVTSTETALFEWCEHSKSPAFKEIQKLVLEKRGSI